MAPCATLAENGHVVQTRMGNLPKEMSSMAAAANPFDVHTAVIEEVREKIFYILGDLQLTARPTAKRPPLPTSQLALLKAIGDSKALSARSRKVVRDAIAELPKLEAARNAATPAVRLKTEVGCAIIYASRTRSDLERGLNLIAELYPDEVAKAGTEVVRKLIKSGEGRIYGSANEQFVEPGHAGSLPKAVYSAKSTLKVDAAAAFGAVAGGLRDPRAIAGAAVAASLVASAEAVLDWIFPEEVPLFPNGSTGPYNPYPGGQ